MKTLDIPTLATFDEHELRDHAHAVALDSARRIAAAGIATLTHDAGSFVVVAPDGTPTAAGAAVTLTTARTGETVIVRLTIRPRIPGKVGYEVGRTDASPTLTGFPRWRDLVERLRNAVLDSESYVLTADPFDVVAA